MPTLEIPQNALIEPGPCPKCGRQGDVMSVRSKTDREWWDEWKGCLHCVAPVGMISQIKDQRGEYTLTLAGGPRPKERKRRF